MANDQYDIGAAGRKNNFLIGYPVVQGSIRSRKNAGDKLTFQFNPETVSVDSAAVWAKQKIPGKHHPVLQYGGGEGRVIKFQLVLHALTSGEQDLDDTIAWLTSLTYPDAQETAVASHEPPRCVLYLGYRKAFNVVVESVNTTHQAFDTRLNTRMAVVDVVALEDEPDAIGYREIRS